MKKNIWYLIVAAGLGMIFAGIVMSYFIYGKMVVKPNKTKQQANAPLPTATPTPDPLAPYSILLLGYGGGIHEGGSTTDTMMVAKIDPRKEEVTLISVPRDLWVPVPINGDETKNFKINAAYPIGLSDKQYPNKKVEFTGKAGGGELAKAMVEKVVGFKIDYFVALDFQGFIKTVDILDGIDVNVKTAFTDPFYPIEANIDDTCGKTDEEVKALTATMSGDKLEQQFSCRYENLHFDKGLQHMDGTIALKFARSRHSLEDGGDFNRATRQRQILTAVRDKVINIGFISKIIPTIQTLTSNLITDIDFAKMNELITKLPEVSKYKIVPIALTDQNVLMNSKSITGQFILIPRIGENNWEEIHRYVEDPQSIITPTPTITPKPTKAIIQSQ